MEENKEVATNVKQKKSKTGLIGIITLIIGLLLGVGGSYYYFEVMGKDNVLEKVGISKEEKNETDKESILEFSTDSLYLKELLEDYDHYTLSSTYLYNILYNKDKVSIAELDESYLRALAVAKTDKNYISAAYFTAEKFQESVTKLFGNQVTLENKTFSIDHGCVTFNYRNDYYSASFGGCGGTSPAVLKREIIKAIKSDSKLEITVAIAIFDESTKEVYKTVDANNQPNNKIEGVSSDSFSIKDNVDKLNQYKYTFTYDKVNDGYVLNTIELVK